MKNKTTLLFAAAAVLILAATTAFTTNARGSREANAQVAAKPVNFPADVIKLRGEFEAQCLVYENLIQPFHQRLEDLSENKLTKAEADELLTEVDETTGEQEKLVQSLKKKLISRIAEVTSQQSAS